MSFVGQPNTQPKPEVYNAWISNKCMRLSKLHAVVMHTEFVFLGVQNKLQMSLEIVKADCILINVCSTADSM